MLVPSTNMIRMLSENGGTTRVEPLITKGAFFTDAGFSFLFRSPELALIATRNSPRHART